MHRRDCLAQLLAGGTTIALGAWPDPSSSFAGDTPDRSATSPLSSEPDPMTHELPFPELPLVDTHQHLWDLSVVRLPWLEGSDENPLRKNHVMADYLAQAEGISIAKTVYMEVDVAVEYQPIEADYVLRLCESTDNPMAGAVIGGHPDRTDFAAYLQRFLRRPGLKGVRRVLHADQTPPGMCLGLDFVKGVSLLGEHGLCFDLCMRPAELTDGAKLAEKCPKTRFVVDHCGNLGVTNPKGGLRSAWETGMKALAAQPNTVCKVSGIVASARPEWQPQDLAENIDFTLATFGEDRVMFASDWPVCTLRASLRQWIAALQHLTAGRSADFRRKLFHDNACAFYKL